MTYVKVSHSENDNVPPHNFLGEYFSMPTQIICSLLFFTHSNFSGSSKTAEDTATQRGVQNFLKQTHY